MCQINISGKYYGVSNQNMTFCYETGRWFHTFPHMRSYTGTKSMFITHFGSQNKWIGNKLYFKYEIYIIMKVLSIITPIITLIFFTTCCSKNILMCKLGLVYRYIVYNEKPHLWQFYTYFADRKNSISNHSVIT